MEFRQQLKYNYVVFASLDIVYNEFWHIMYNDLQGKKGIRYIDTPFENRAGSNVLRQIHRFHYHDFFNKIVMLPLKSLWNGFYYNEKSKHPDSICFVFFMTALTKYNETFFRYLKKQYPGCKMAVYFDDIVSAFSNVWTFDHSLAEKYFDIKISYDIGDCKRYNYLYYPTSYSVVDIQDNPAIKKSDLFFCGAAKKRYDQITNIYKRCQDGGLTNDFIIARYGGDSKIDGIEYVPYVMPYSNYLEHMIKSNCLLDIIQDGSKGFTIRTWEALVYGKKMLTNNRSILDAPFYDAQQFCYFEEIGNREIDFIKKDTRIEPRYIDELSPIRMIEFIDKNLSEFSL